MVPEPWVMDPASSRDPMQETTHDREPQSRAHRCCHRHAERRASNHQIRPPSGNAARPVGASIEEISEALSWQQHSARAALTGLHKKGHVIIRGKQSSITTYRIVC